MSASKTSTWTILQNVIGLVSGRAFVSLSRLLIAIIIVRIAGAEVFGQFVVVMSIVYIGEWLMDFGFTDIAVRNISQDIHKRNGILDAFTAIKIVQAILAFSAAVIAINLLGYSELIPGIAVGGIGLICYGAAQIYRVNFRVDMVMYKDMKSESAGVLVMILLALALSFGQASVTEFVACYTISRIVYFAANIYHGSDGYRPKIKIGHDDNFSLLCRQAAPLGIAGVTVACYDSIAPLALSKLMDMEAVALYTVAIRLVFPIVLVTQAISNVFYTPLSNYWSTDRKLFASTQQNLVEIVCLVSCCFFCVVYSSADFIVSFFGESMSESAAILRVLSWAILARAMTTAMSSPIVISGGQKKAMWITLMVVIFSFVLVIYLVPIYGIAGAVGTYLFVEIFVTAIPVVFVSLRMAHYSLAWLPIGKIFFASGVAVGTVSYTSIHGSLLGGIVSVVFFMAVTYLTGGVSKEKILSIIAAVKNR
ncbi:MAG: oligosaccharide flippase family protein [Halioglobus sp.]